MDRYFDGMQIKQKTYNSMLWLILLHHIFFKFSFKPVTIVIFKSLARCFKKHYSSHTCQG